MNQTQASDIHNKTKKSDQPVMNILKMLNFPNCIINKTSS